MFSNEERCILEKNQLSEVICQFRFPDILVIDSQVPAQFQEQIRDAFPQYSVRMEAAAPKITGAPGNMQLENQPATHNYQFVSADGMWRVNLTSKFISLSCARYTGWEDFAQMLDKPLAAFIQTYHPAYFERAGLRYINFISRNRLQLQDTPFHQLIAPAYLGPLSEEDVPEPTVSKCAMDVEMAIRGGCRVRIHAGPGRLKMGQKVDPETRFILDFDLFMPGKIPVNMTTGALNTLHSQAFGLLRGAITDTLYEAMEPRPL